ncbi:uncharacterized protein LOC107009811 [Solanum pennellii]|uniref:Uncharacterized protein LOC107009811 n=1 Tax=Solanum pennellii TaxID=28526 RepID=A0ABM1G1J1_SOLPN|nr:uncharacterized protein LOC107009811 [Solanum pennellii]
MAEYEACILGHRWAIDLDVQETLIIGDLDILIHQVRGDWPNHNYIDPIHIYIHEQPDYYLHVEEEPDGKPWYDDIRGYLKRGDYTEDATNVQKRKIQRRTHDLGVLRCVEAGEARRLVEEIRAVTCDPHMNGFTLAKKILRS